MHPRITDDPDNEQVDIVDKYNLPIRVDTRKNKPTAEGEYVRAAHCFLMNSAGHIWVPTRSPNKRTMPNAYDFSASGYVQSGENYIKAMQREIAEEMQMSKGTYALKYLGTLNPFEDGTVGFVGVFVVRKDFTPNYNEEDFSDGSWMTISELKRKIAEGHPFKSDVIKVLPLVEILLDSEET